LLLASSDYEPDAELRETRMLLMRGVDGIVYWSAATTTPNCSP